MATINTDFAALCPHVDADYVRDLLTPPGSDLTDSQLNARINIAYYQTIGLVGELGDCGGNDAYCEIAALVAAHAVTLSERQVKRESVAQEWTIEYLGNAGEGLKASLFGQQAIAMDCSGILAEQAEGVKRTSFKVYAQIDIDDVDLTDY